MVEIIPKKPEKALPWQKIIYGAGGFLATVVLIYGILFYFSAKASAGLENLKGEIAKTGTLQDRALEKELFEQKKLIDNFADLLSKRTLSAGFFENFEEDVHPKVWFSSFALDVFNKGLTVSGETINFQTLSQQLMIFKEDKKISQADLSSLSVGKEGGVEFKISLSLDQLMFAP